MINQNRIAGYINPIIAIIVILVAALGLPRVIAELSSTNFTIAVVFLTLIYAMAVVANEESKELKWTGFTRLPLVASWVMFGLSSATLIAVIGTLIAHVYKRWTPTTKSKPPRLKSLLNNFSNSGASILGMHAIYVVFGGYIPQLDATGIYSTFYLMIGSLLASSLISIVFVSITQAVSIEDIIADANHYLVPEILVILAGLVLPIIFVQVNVVVFIVILAFIAMQIYRQAQVKRTETQLKQRIHEMGTLNHLGTTIAAQLSLVGAIESVYGELSKLLNATTIYIALYNADQDTLDYRLVVVDGKRVSWEKHKLGNGLAEYVIREKQPIRFIRDEVRRKLKNLYDVSQLSDQHYMLVPLTVSTKVIGLLGVRHATNPEAFSEYDFALFKAMASQASLAIRNAMLYDRTVRLADNLSIINQSLQDVMFNLDRKDALKASCQIAANVTRTSKAAIFLLEPTLDSQMKCVESVGFEDVAFVETVLYQPNLFQNGARVINNVATSNEQDIIKQAEAGQFKACVQIPLRSGNTIVGTLGVYHEMPYYYEPPELNLLEMLTNQITAALDNADLLQALELYAAEQAQLVHLSRISGSTLELERLINDVCAMLAQMMNVTRAAIGVWYPEKNTLLIESPDGSSFGLTTVELQVPDIPEIESMLEPNGLASLRIFHIGNSTYSVGLTNYMSEHGDATLGIIPMRLNHDIIGLIFLGNTSTRHFSDNDFRLLEMANHQITVQIHNARVHTQTEEQLASRLEQLALIEDIAQQISEALELDLIIQNVLEAALQSTQANFAAIALIDNESRQMFDIIWREVVDDHLVPNRITLQMTNGIVGHVARTGKMIIVPENEEFEAYVEPTGVTHKFRSSLAVPMLTANRVLGVLNLESVHPNFFTMEQASFTRSLAGHAAISIDNTNLLVERERQINTLTLLRELSLDALSVINPEHIFAAALRTALILLTGSEAMLYSYDHSQKSIQLIKSLRFNNGQVMPSTPLIPEEILLETVQKGSLQILADVSASAIYQNYSRFADVTHQSLVMMPVTRRQQIQEILCIGFDEARRFTYDDLNTVDLLGAQVAGHLENAALSEAITTSNDRMRAILDSTRDGIILLDNNEIIQDANSAAIDLTGIKLQTYLFKSLSDIAHLPIHTEQSADVWQKITEIYQKSPDSIHNQEFIFEREDDLVHVKMLVTRVSDKTNETVGRLLILRDITEEKKLQDFRETMQSMVLHDLRGPLTAIVTSMYVAENILALYDGSDFDDLKDSLTKTFGVSLSSAEDMLRQVDTLRDLPMMNQMQVKPQLLPMYDIAQGAYSSLSANFLDSNIEVEIEVEPRHIVFVDESLIHRVIINLLHNAFKFTPVGGKVLIRLLENSDKSDYVCVQIADTGPGIPEEHRERIFGVFEQIDGNKPRTGGKGTGLGLNFCKLAVEAHGGKIRVEANGPLSGACFSFSIPTTDWRDTAQMMEA